MPVQDTVPSSPRPWVVCDWGALRGMRRDAPMPKNLSLVLCDALFLEAVDSEHPEPLVEKLRAILESPGMPQRILFARHWGMLSRAELSPGHRMRGADLVDSDITDRLQRGLAHREAWPKRLMQGRDSPEFDRYLEYKREFVRECEEFADHPGHRTASDLSALRSHAASPIDWIRSPNLVPAFVQAIPTARRFCSAAWLRALRTFPDRHAIGRQVRITAWYALRRFLRRDENAVTFGNNYEDAQYAFLASYSYELATRDKGLRDCVTALFPKVRIRDGIEGQVIRHIQPDHPPEP